MVNAFLWSDYLRHEITHIRKILTLHIDTLGTHVDANIAALATAIINFGFHSMFYFEKGEGLYFNIAKIIISWIDDT